MNALGTGALPGPKAGDLSSPWVSEPQGRAGGGHSQTGGALRASRMQGSQVDDFVKGQNLIQTHKQLRGSGEVPTGHLDRS
jgi:hypothetical protein